MPTWNFKNTKTGEEVEHFFQNWKAKEEWCEANPDFQTLLGAPSLVSGVSLGKGNKPAEGFRELLRNAKKKNPRSNINTWD
jgi:hypothetical protein